MLAKIITNVLIIVAAISVFIAATTPEEQSFIKDAGTCTKKQKTEFMVTLDCKNSGTITLSCEEKLWRSIKAGESYVIIYKNHTFITDQLISAKK
jgi:hypothetical protein